MTAHATHTTAPPATSRATAARFLAAIAGDLDARTPRPRRQRGRDSGACDSPCVLVPFHSLALTMTRRAPSMQSQWADPNSATSLGQPGGELTVEAIAERVAELLIDHVGEPFRLIATPVVARMLAVSQGWVRDHASELGAIRVGDGPKGALRFDPRRVRAALERRRVERPGEASPGRPGPRRRSRGVAPTAIPADVKEW